MEQANEPAMDNAAASQPPANLQRGSVTPEGAAGSCGCNGNGAPLMAPAHVYAIGKVEPRFPSLALEKEFAQVTGRTDSSGLTDRQALQKTLADRSNRYLARQLCWILSIEGLETYLLEPRDPADLDLFIEAVRPAPRPTDMDVVIGMRGAVASPDVCNGLMLPMVAVDQLYSFDRDSLIKSIPRPEGIAKEKFGATAEELFDRIMLMTDNAGATDEHRALNYLAVRYPAIYASAADAHGRNSSLAAVEVRPSALSGARRIVDVIFSYTNRSTDVTEEFPFLVTKLSPYYDR